MTKTERREARSSAIFNKQAVTYAAAQSFRMLSPRVMIKNPVMFVTEMGAVLSTISLFAVSADAYAVSVTLILWLTVVFANFAEALAEAKGKAGADSLKQVRRDTVCTRLTDGGSEKVGSSELKVGDRVLVCAGDIIPCDGEVDKGIASVDESAITGESAPVIRESGGDRSGVTAGTKVLTGDIEVIVTAGAGESFLDRMIALVEGAVRQKTPNELALTVTLAGLTLAFLLVTTALLPIGRYFGAELSIPTLTALLVCLIPTTISALLPAIGIAGMNRALAANILAKSGKAVELAGDIDTILLDKTGTITVGNRQAVQFVPVSGVTEAQLTETAMKASFGDMTPEGKSIVALAEQLSGSTAETPADAAVISFSAHTRLSGVDTNGHRLRKGAYDAVTAFVQQNGGRIPADLKEITDRIASAGCTPIVVAENDRILGVISLSDVLKAGIQSRFARLRAMGLRIIMVTGDNPLTAKSIAGEAGVDGFVAEAKPEDKLNYIRKEQKGGRLIAMIGDGTNDAPALAQADIGVAMNSGTQAAKEAGNMVDLDNNPTKLIEVIEIGKQLLMTRGALTTFSVSNDVAKYFAIIPAMFILAMPHLAGLNIMNLASPESAVLSALIFNAVVIPALIPLAIKGVRFRAMGADALLKRNLLIYGFGGVVLPFAGIKVIDMILSATGMF
ncbi:potassium-transporting ATPase subunit KdpB [Seleniivibrio woodruffii]|uniref:potassium-transporting ATPase subunit KdpB n=1 Tax=Seleniivibrio woodruffii TaxID=1078050 RepID=UPI0026F2F522|nr:potassium-transporting ATPase subunit KdpB [Seleniivibrio woodruffii]